MTTVKTHMSFIEPWNYSKGNPCVRGSPLPGLPATNYDSHDHAVSIRDARLNKHDFHLDVHGFAYHDDTHMTPELLDLLRANDKTAVKERYYPLVERLVREKTGATRVVLFDHTVRRRDPSVKDKYDTANGRAQPASLVHCDQSTVGAIRRLHGYMGDEADRLLQGRAQIINVWRPLRGPVQDWPLATMDGRTLRDSDVHPTNIFKNRYTLVGQTVSVTHDPEQRWYYLDGQNTDEVTFIKIWDNKEGVESRLCAHAAFPHPETPVEAPLRESMEVRCLVFYD